MPVAIDEFVKIIETIAPAELACEWDNTGLLVRCSSNVQNVLIALDFTPAVFEEAVKQKCDMILCHHPVMMVPQKSFDYGRMPDAMIMRLMEAGISLYAAHTSYDSAEGGINDALAEKLGLLQVKTIAERGEGIMRTGILPQPCGEKQLIERVKQALEINNVRISRGSYDKIDKVAVVGGSGGDFIAAAKNEGAKALITGEAKYHHFIEAKAFGVFLIEAGHYDTEKCFVDSIFMSLQSRLNEVQCGLGLRKATCEKAPYVHC